MQQVKNASTMKGKFILGVVLMELGTVQAQWRPQPETSFTWRKDKTKFTAAMLGSAHDGWPKWWLDIRQQPVRDVIASRLQSVVGGHGCGLDGHSDTARLRLPVQLRQPQLKLQLKLQQLLPELQSQLPQSTGLPPPPQTTQDSETVGLSPVELTISASRNNDQGISTTGTEDAFETYTASTTEFTTG
ncbi:hypothetical protein HK100_009368 [Physocladia obscura]|uniref:Uncharacterized protein n=1 Tax=Physocladia obscura TaxID=109957 RepID=A0AAD5SNL4_9FUNG|nr:hypothetical protein HK100_009368 [Physocladia obscura]